MKRHLLLSLLLIATTIAFAKPRTQTEALSIAKDFFEQSASAATRSNSEIQLVGTSTDFMEVPTTRFTDAKSIAYYIYNWGHNAFVIISGDDRMKTILGYSNSGPFVTENIPGNIKYFLNTYVDELSEIENLPEGVEKVKIEETSVPTRAFQNAIAPLLGDIKWNQDAPYNNKCPLDDSQPSASGCVATAMAMIMKYHSYPNKGQGYYSYSSKTKGLSCSFDYSNTTFDWNNMLPQYGDSYTQAQADAVATLMYACGVAVDMDYTNSESGAFGKDFGEKLIEYFNYDENNLCIDRDLFLYKEWMEKIKTELNASRPIFYTGRTANSGHAFVLDGYDAKDLVHINWGWGGNSDGYFSITELNPANPGIGGGDVSAKDGFAYGQSMIIGIQKPTSSSVYSSQLACSELILPVKINPGGVFTPTIVELYNMGNQFNGDIAIVLEKDGKQTVVGNAFNTNREVRSWYYITSTRNLKFSDVNSTMKLPSNLEDGTYLLYAASKHNTKETTWKPIRGVVGDNYMYNFIVSESGSKINVEPYWGDLSVRGATNIVHTLYQNRNADFHLQCVNINANQEFYGDVAVGLFDDAGSFIGSFPKRIYLEPSEMSQVYTLSGYIPSTLPAGNYSIAPIASWKGNTYYIGDQVSIVIKEAVEGNAEVDIAEANFTSSQVREDEQLNLKATINISSDHPLYDSYVLTLLAYKADNGTYPTLSQHQHKVFVEKDTPYQLEANITHNLTEGTYYWAMFKYSDTEKRYKQATSIKPFTVLGATGIADLEDDATEHLIVYPLPVKDVLNIKFKKQIMNAEIYDMSGQLISSTNLSGSFNEYAIQVADLSVGTYILVLQTEDGILKEKFIKQ